MTNMPAIDMASMPTMKLPLHALGSNWMAVAVRFVCGYIDRLPEGIDDDCNDGLVVGMLIWTAVGALLKMFELIIWGVGWIENSCVDCLRLEASYIGDCECLL